MRVAGVGGESLRNEAIFRDRRLDGWSYGGGFGVGLGAFGGLEAAEFAEGGVVVALGGIDAALEAGENVAVFFEDQAEGDVEDVQGVFPELCLDGAEAAEEPFAIDEGIDEGTLFGGGWLEAIEVFGGELVEGRLGFTTDDQRPGVDAGLQSVHRGAGLAFIGARSGGFLRVAAIGRDLLLGCHTGRG